MKRRIVFVCAVSALLSLSVKADILTEYRFDQTNKVADVVAPDITAGNINWDTGSIASSDGKANPYGMPHWKKYGTAATIDFTLASSSGSASYTNLSFALQMDSTTGTKERKLEITSSATGGTVLHTIYNYAAWQSAGSNVADDKTFSEWIERDVDLSGYSALQDVSGAVTFTLAFSDTIGGGVDGNLRMDNIGVAGVIPEPASLGLIGMVGGFMIIIRRFMLV